jgi:hypothetical protein
MTQRGAQRPDPREGLPPWRETPLDHWSTDVDPVLMAGDEWAMDDPEADPGARRLDEGRAGTLTGGARFMHPTHDTNWGLEDDNFSTDGMDA